MVLVYTIGSGGTSMDRDDSNRTLTSEQVQFVVGYILMHDGFFGLVKAFEEKFGERIPGLDYPIGSPVNNIVNSDKEAMPKFSFNESDPRVTSGIYEPEHLELVAEDQAPSVSSGYVRERILPNPYGESRRVTPGDN